MKFKFWEKNEDKKDEVVSPPAGGGVGGGGSQELTWDVQASQALEMAIAQAPVPAMLKNKVKNELRKTAEETTRAAGRTTVTAEDLVTGMMAKLPPDMQKKAQEMIEKKTQGQ